jgi:hypothetical protein
MTRFPACGKQDIWHRHEPTRAVAFGAIAEVPSAAVFAIAQDEREKRRSIDERLLHSPVNV